jgi:hypothetical protein
MFSTSRVLLVGVLELRALLVLELHRPLDLSLLSLQNFDLALQLHARYVDFITRLVVGLAFLAPRRHMFRMHAQFLFVNPLAIRHLLLVSLRIRAQLETTSVQLLLGSFQLMLEVDEYLKKKSRFFFCDSFVIFVQNPKLNLCDSSSEEPCRHS